MRCEIRHQVKKNRWTSLNENITKISDGKCNTKDIEFCHCSASIIQGSNSSKRFHFQIESNIDYVQELLTSLYEGKFLCTSVAPLIER